MVFRRDGFCRPMQIPRPGVIAKSLPMKQNVVLCCLCKRYHIRIIRQELLKVWKSLLHASLLKNNLREPNNIRVLGLTPRKLPFMHCVPMDDIVGKSHGTKVLIFWEMGPTCRDVKNHVPLRHHLGVPCLLRANTNKG